MAASRHSENSWKDILEAAGFAQVFWLFMLPGGALEYAAKRVERFAESDPKPSPLAFLSQPLRVVAKAVDDAGERFSRNDKFPFGTAIAAAAPAIFVGCKAAVATGFSWSALAAGGHALAMSGAALTGLGAAVVLYPFVATALGMAVTLTMGLCLATGRVPALLTACRDGMKNTVAWRPARNPPPLQASTPVVAATPSPPSVLMQNFEQVAADIEKQDPAERQRFLNTLRRKFPAEFADAVRLETHAPELRKDIQIQKPLKLRPLKKRYVFPGAKL